MYLSTYFLKIACLQIFYHLGDEPIFSFNCVGKCGLCDLCSTNPGVTTLCQKCQKLKLLEFLKSYRGKDTFFWREKSRWLKFLFFT